MINRRAMMKGVAAALVAVGVPLPTTPSDVVPVLLVNESLIPEAWAHESLRLLEENMVVGALVHKDFDRVINHEADDIDIGFTIMDERLKTVRLG